MKTMVQTFIVEESKELIYDSDSIQEWKEKCESLGLSEQLALASEDKSPMPFEFMNTVQMRVYETICPMKQDYKKYNKTAIPLEVLSLIALAEKEHYFEKIEIWYDDKAPDPIAVGLIKENTYSFRNYAIARWGDSIRSFDELKDKAMELYKNSTILSLKRKIAESESLLKQVENNTALYFDAQVENYHVQGF